MEENEIRRAGGGLDHVRRSGFSSLQWGGLDLGAERCHDRCLGKLTGAGLHKEAREDAVVIPVAGTRWTD